jgi:hypothetical protein
VGRGGKRGGEGLTLNPSMCKGSASDVAMGIPPPLTHACGCASVSPPPLGICRVVYSLARLQLHLPQLLAAVESSTAGQLRTATPQSLAGLAVGLAHWGYRPSAEWIRELCMEAFSAMDGFAAQVSQIMYLAYIRLQSSIGGCTVCFRLLSNIE